MGDCAAHYNLFAGGRTIRLESVQNANDQAATAAMSIIGNPTPYRSLPWFWSNQFNLKLQTVGLSIGHDEVLIRGDPHVRSFTLGYLRNGVLIAVDCVNAVKDYVQVKSLIQNGARVDQLRFSDPMTPLKELGSANHLTTTRTIKLV